MIQVAAWGTANPASSFGLARGIDNTANFKHYAPPSTAFAEPNLSLYEEIRNEQAKALAAGLEDKTRLFSN